MSMCMTRIRIPETVRRILPLKWTNHSFITQRTGSSIIYGVRLVQLMSFCSNSKNDTVEASLISIFSKRPFCLESPELQELGSKLSPGVAEMVLRSFKNWKSALVFFNWAKNQQYAHSCYLYNAMAAILSGARQNAPMRDLAINLTKSRCSWTPGAFGYFLRCLGSQGLVEEANSLFDQVKISGICVLNGYSYNCLLEVFAKSGDIDLLELRMDEMRKSGWPIDKHALTPALQCYCNGGKFDKALIVFNDLNDKGLVDQHILAILVLSYSKFGEVDMAFELIEWAERNLNISLNEKTLCVLIHGLVRERRVDKALELYEKMKKVRYLPDISIYDALVRGLCENNEIGKALTLYTHMRGSGISPDVRIISRLLLCIQEHGGMIQLLEDSLIDFDACKRMLMYSSISTSLVNGGHVDKAYHLLKECMGSSTININPDTGCFQTVIDGLCRADKLDMALDLFRNMDRVGCRRSVLLFNNLIQCLSNADRLSECFDLLREMKEKETDVRPTHFTFNCILGCLCRRLDVAGTLDLLTMMRVYGHEPWIKNYTLLVKKLCERGEADEAYEFLTEMSERGFVPDNIAYSATIDGLMNIDRLDRGIEIFREICGRGYRHDVVGYNTIIKGLCKAKRVTEAEGILEELLGKGLVPSVVTYNLLIDGWCKDGDADRAVLCFSEMIERGHEPNLITYTTIVHGLCDSGRPDDALNLWAEMERKGCRPNRIAYMALIHGLCKCRRPDCALVYLHEMEEKDMRPDNYICEALVNAFESNSNIDMANQVLEKFHKSGTAA